MENPAFKNKQCYEPRRMYRRNDYSNREYSEMWTADWWWEMQVRIFFNMKIIHVDQSLPKELLPEGATVAPVVLSSDKTNLTRFSGDKQAWPVYLTVGNIAKEIRRKPTERAMVLTG